MSDEPEKFEAGDIVPKWVYEMSDPNADIRFGADVHVWDRGDHVEIRYANLGTEDGTRPAIRVTGNRDDAAQTSRPIHFIGIRSHNIDAPRWNATAPSSS